MAEVPAIKHPSLAEYLNQGKEWYDIWVKNKGQVAMTWEQVAAEMTAEHKLVSSWDETKRNRYWYTKSHRNRAALLRVQDEIKRYRTAERAKKLGLDSLAEMKDVHAKSKKRK